MASPRHSREPRSSKRDAQARYWLIRIALNVDLLTPSPTNRLEVLDMILAFIGARAITNHSPRSSIKKYLRGHAKRLDCQAFENSTPLARNVDMLGEMLALEPLHKEILAFVICIHDDAALRDVASFLAPGGRRTFYRGMAALFNRSDAEMRTALSAMGPLVGNGLVWIDMDGSTLGMQLEVMEGLAARLLEERNSVDELMQGFLEPAPQSTLTMCDFRHIEADVDLLSNYLELAIAMRTIGVNALLYGLPGTGKTELARLIGAKMGGSVYQVRCIDDAKESISGKERLASYQLCQRFLASGANSIIIFDEIEDVFPADTAPSGFRVRQSPSAFGKAWMNSLLENNAVPTIWISNEVSQIDHAYLRRFDFAIEFRRLPTAARRRTLEKHLESVPNTHRVIDQLAAQNSLLPSQVAKAAKIVSVGTGGERGGEAVLLRAVQASMKLLDMRVGAGATRNADGCRLEYFSSDLDIAALIANLKVQRRPRGAICLYGPPGTGKTLLAHLIAAELDKPILAKKGSDLLSPFVGGTEQQIAEMFEEAGEEESVLLLDEADGLLMDRQEARQRWEFTQVNELLTQMDQFAGLLICATNLVSKLDVASLRRFDIKVRFDYLTLQQRYSLFCETLRLEAVASDWCDKLKQLHQLTPGDFAVAKRHATLMGQSLDPASLFQLLRDECLAKQPHASGQIGFLN